MTSLAFVFSFLPIIKILLFLIFNSLWNWLKIYPFFSFHDPIVFLDNEFFNSFVFQVRVIVLFLWKFLLDITDNEMFRNYGVK